MVAHGYGNLSYVEIEVLFRRFDKGNNGKVSYRDFLQEIISK